MLSPISSLTSVVHGRAADSLTTCVVPRGRRGEVRERLAPPHAPALDGVSLPLHGDLSVLQEEELGRSEGVVEKRDTLRDDMIGLYGLY